MKILVTNTEPVQVYTGGLSGHSTMVTGWLITYQIEFDELEEHLLTGKFEWKHKVLDLEEVVKHIHETFTKLMKVK